MELMIVAKAICGIGSVVSGLISCVYWYQSSKAEVPHVTMKRGVDELIIEVEGREIEVFATSRLQSSLGAKGALAAAVAASFQLLPMIYDVWGVITG